MTNLRTATIEDFKVGTILFTYEGYSFRLTSKYSEGTWESRGMEGQGCKCIFTGEAKYYKVKA